MNPIATSQAHSLDDNSYLSFEIDAKPEDSECFTNREQTFEESDHDVLNLTDCTSSGVGSTISFPSHDDVRGGHRWKNLKRNKLQTSKSVPEFYDESLLEQEGNNYVFHIESANMCQFASGQGRNKLSTGEDDTVLNTADLSKRLRDNTKRLLRDVKNIEPKVDTELLRYGKAKLTRSKKIPFIILKGSGCGCKFTAKTLFQDELNRNEEAVGYCLTDPKHFSEIDLNQKSVVLILDACGGTQFNKHRIDEWHEAVRNCMPSAPVVNSDVTIIMTVQNFDEVNEHPLLKEYSTHVLDATSKMVRPSTETKKEMVIAIMKQHCFEIEPPKKRVSDESNGFFLKRELIETIGPLLGSTGYVRRLNQFFRNSTSEGIHFFSEAHT